MRYALNRCACVEKYEPTHVYVFTGPCVESGQLYSVSVPADGLFKYHQGAMIQDAFPNVLSEDREFLMSGISPASWNKMFGNDPENS